MLIIKRQYILEKVIKVYARVYLKGNKSKKHFCQGLKKKRKKPCIPFKPSLSSTLGF